MSKLLFEQCVSTLEERPIDSILNDSGKLAGYGTTEDAIRYHSPEPIYTAVWIVSADDKDRYYSPPHKHNFVEQNILAAAPGELVYKILIGDEEREVESPAIILIPPGVPHSANILRGTGTFVVTRYMPDQIAASYTLGEEYK